MSKKKKYEILVPPQMELFKISDDLRDYSHMVELYDLIPKYYHGSANRINGKYLDSIEREFEFSVRKASGERISKKYKVRIAPANVKHKNSEKYFYPSQREELVEDALRKIAVEKGGVYVNGQAGVKFTLYEVEQELKRRGHGYSRAQIKEAIDVCKGTQIELQSLEGDKSVEYKFNIFEDVAFASNGGDAKNDHQSYVSFNKMVTSSINKKEFRLYNYSKGISFKYILSRWLFKRMSYNFRQASGQNPYNIKLSTIIRDSGMTSYQKISHNIAQVKKGLDELQASDIIESYSSDIFYDESRKNKIKDVKFIIYLTDEFCKDIKTANYFDDKLQNGKKQKVLEQQGELLDLKKTLTAEMERDIFALDKNFIKKFAANLSNKSDIDTATLALKAAIETIETYESKGTKFSAIAITKTALKESWIPQNYAEENAIEINKEIENWGRALDSKNQEKFDEFLNEIKLGIGEQVFNLWFFIDLVEVSEQIIFEIKSEFIKQELEEKFSNIIADICQKIFAINSFELRVR